MNIELFQKAIDDAAIHLFTQKGYKYENKYSAFIQYVNLQLKLIYPSPRKVSYSTRFNVSDKNKTGFNILVQNIENGADVNTYLSKLSVEPGFSDDLLDNFGVKHFHLGEQLQGDFIERTGEIALSFVTPNEIFFIITKMHGQGHGTIWYEKDVLEIIHEERPDLIEKFKFKYLHSISPETTEPTDIKKLTKNNVTFPITLDDGTTYFPPIIARTTQGYPLECTNQYIQLPQALKALWDMDILELQNEGYEFISGRVTNFEFTTAKLIDFCFEFKCRFSSTDPNCPNGEVDFEIPHQLEKGLNPVNQNNIQISI